MVLDTLIRDGQLVIPARGVVEASLGIKNGVIHGMYKNGSEPEARQVIEAGGKYILPGALDPHMHLGFAGPFEEHFSTETASSAIGGITTIIHHHFLAGRFGDFRKVVELGESRSHVDFAFHLMLVSDESLANVGNYIKDYGVRSFKIFMGYKGEEAKQVGLPREIDDGFLFSAMEEVRKHPDAVVCIHAENNELIATFKERLMKAGRNDLPAWDDARPGFAEAENVQRASYFAQITGCPVYFVHLSAAESVKKLAQYKAAGVRAYGETCSHYLSHTRNEPLGNLGKVNPPLRSQEDVDAMWEALRTGVLDTVASDHGGFPRKKKDGDLWSAMPGFPGVATILPVLLSEGVNRNRISIQRVAEVSSYNTARIFGLYPRKGTIDVGSDADLVMVDLDLEKTVTPQLLGSMSDFTIYDGWRLKGWPVLTMVRGEVVMKDGKIVGGAGKGRYARWLPQG